MNPAFHESEQRDRLYHDVRESEARYRHIVETASEGIWIIDAESKTTFVNRQMADMLGYEHKRADEERLRLSKLESLGLLAGGIAHDFNNLLTAILGNLSLARLSVPSIDPIHTRLDEAEQACLRAKDLTQQLLTFALRGSNVRCEWDILDDIWTMEIDPGQINQVIQNLVINADQAMPEGGRLTIRCANVVLKAPTTLQGLSLQAGAYVKITVADQGVGIPADQMSKIFDPYFTTKPAGTGLGLTTVYTIIKRHDGAITVDSTPGVGTTFDLYLPAHNCNIHRSSITRSR